MKLIAIDGNSIINRAFYGIRALTSPDGTPTNAVYGFLATYFKYVAEESADAVCVCFDLHAPTFRHNEYADYKAGRRATPDELRIQIPLLKEVLDAMGVARLECEGYEADDLLGTLSKKCEDADESCVVLTGDRDSLQLAGPCTVIKLVTTKMGKTESNDYDPMRIQLDYGVTPEQLIEVKALMGDKSDNIPGVPGIGEKTALALVAANGSVTNIYEKLDSIDATASVKAKLESGRDSAMMSLRLARIVRDAPVEFNIRDARPSAPDQAALYSLFARLGFDSFIKKLGLKPGAPSDSVADGQTSGQTAFAAQTAPDGQPDSDEEGGQLGFAVPEARQEQASPWPEGGISEVSAFVPTYEGGAITALSAYDGSGSFRTSDAGEIAAYFENGAEKRCFGVKETLAALTRMGVSDDGKFFDAMLASYCINESPEAGLAGSPAAIYDSAQGLRSRLDERGAAPLYAEMELPLSRVIAGMETEGFALDMAELQKFGEMLDKRIETAESCVYQLAGERFNINSTRALGQILFERLGLPPLKKTKTGYSTDVDTLEKILATEPANGEIIGFVLEYRKLTKLKSTYVVGLSKVVGADSRVRSTFYQTGTATGRLSSSDPNLQNIPVRTELGREMRRMFVAREGYSLIDADYSQIELRILAHMADDKAMINAFADGEDIHTVTASQVFGVAPDEVTKEMRSRAKAVNFGIVYGISDFSLADDIHVSRKEAREYIDRYFGHYPGVKRFMEETVALARENGYVETLFGRRRYVPDINAKNFNLRSGAERIARNTPIQGTAADVIKLAMVRVYNALQSEKLDAKLILQVHDELIVEARDSDAERVKILLEREMENAASFKVRLAAEAGVGKTWLSAKA